jgi:DNA polymerase V
VPKHAHGTVNLKFYTASSKMMLEAMLKLYDDIVNPNYTVRRLTVVANHVLLEEQAPKPSAVGQMTLFTDYEAVEKEREAEQKELEKEKRLQKAMLEVKKKYGKNAMLKGVNFEEGATARERNKQIGGHKA